MSSSPIVVKSAVLPKTTSLCRSMPQIVCVVIVVSNYILCNFYQFFFLSKIVYRVSAWSLPTLTRCPSSQRHRVIVVNDHADTFSAYSTTSRTHVYSRILANIFAQTKNFAKPFKWGPSGDFLFFKKSKISSHSFFKENFIIY